MNIERYKDIESDSEFVSVEEAKRLAALYSFSIDLFIEPFSDRSFDDHSTPLSGIERIKINRRKRLVNGLLGRASELQAMAAADINDAKEIIKTNSLLNL
jgi:hypothetical protein